MASQSKPPPTRQGAKFQANPALDAYMKGAGMAPAKSTQGIKEESSFADGSRTAGESTLLINGLQINQEDNIKDQ